MENRKRKIGWKMSFLLFGWEKKKKKGEIENRGESFPSGPTFFILPIWEENEEKNVLRNAFYTNTLSPTLHFTHNLITFASPLPSIVALAYFIFYFWQCCLLFFSFDFLGCLFSSSRQKHCLFFKSWACLSFFFCFSFFFFFFPSSSSKVAFSFPFFFLFFFFLWFSMGWAWIFFYFYK